MFQPARIQHGSCICMAWIIMYILIQKVCGLIKPGLDSLKMGSFPTQQKKKKDAAFYCLLRARGKKLLTKPKTNKKKKIQEGKYRPHECCKCFMLAQARCDQNLLQSWLCSIVWMINAHLFQRTSVRATMGKFCLTIISSRPYTLFLYTDWTNIIGTKRGAFVWFCTSDLFAWSHHFMSQ